MRQAALGEDSICIGYISREVVANQTMASVVNALRLPEVSGYIWTASGPYLDDGRNICLANMLATGCEVALFFDSEIIFTPEDVLTVANAAHRRNAVVGGLYYGMPRDIEAIAYRRRPSPLEPGQEMFRSLTKETAKNRPHTLLRCDAVGTGFMAIPRALALDIEQPRPLPWFSEPVIDEVHLGEDMAFCTLVKSMGYDVFVHRGARVKHAKTVILDPNL
jgi:hypothetical protein